MWSSWLNNSALPALEQTSAFAEKRHMLLAGNVANMDTPGYTTRDLSVDEFHSALKTALSAQQATHMPGSVSVDGPQAMEKVRDVSRQILYHDGSDVSLEEQVTQISKNQSMHNMAIALMRSQFQNLQVAIRESAAV